jgi:hypothetical protein
MSQSRRVVITKDRSVNTYAELWRASGFLLQVGIRSPQGAANQFLASLLLTAFSFEAYLNHIGPECLTCWNDVERLPPLAKLHLLAETLEVRLPKSVGQRPLQTVHKLIAFRNTIAHGRSSELTYELAGAKKHERELLEPLLADWEKLTQTSEFAVRAREDVEAVLQLLQASRKNEADYLFTTDAGSGSARLENAP